MNMSNIGTFASDVLQIDGQTYMCNNVTLTQNFNVVTFSISQIIAPRSSSRCEIIMQMNDQLIQKI